MRRILRWDGCVNVRDLGGLPTRDGGETRYGVVVRADSLRTLTDAGRAALTGYGVTRAIDLRGDNELEEDAHGELPVPVVRIPIDPSSNAAVREWRTLRDAYVALLDGFQQQFARALVELARSQPPVAIHCAGGRDRTGITCGLVSWLAEVEPDAIAADHALSDESWGPHNEWWIDAAADEWERERRRRVSAPVGRTLAELLEELERRQGVRAYLVGGGASDEDLDTLVLRLRG